MAASLPATSASGVLTRTQGVSVLSTTHSAGPGGRIETGRILVALERAFAELPTGSAAERLTHFCGRLFDVLRSPDFAAACRTSRFGFGEGDAARAVLVACLGATAALVKDGLDRGEFAAPSAGVVARLLVASLFARAHWCAESSDAGLRGVCSRAVAETLELIWPALGVPHGSVPRAGSSHHT